MSKKPKIGSSNSAWWTPARRKEKARQMDDMYAKRYINDEDPEYNAKRYGPDFKKKMKAANKKRWANATPAMREYHWLKTKLAVLTFEDREQAPKLRVRLAELETALKEKKQ